VLVSARSPWGRFPPREIADPAAAAAARAACLAASSAYTHPLADVQQTKHLVGPAAYAALALELARADDPVAAARELRRAIEEAPPEAREVLRQMPPRQPGKSRLGSLFYELDAANSLGTRTSSKLLGTELEAGVEAGAVPVCVWEA
jgi:hypothetical protein